MTKNIKILINKLIENNVDYFLIPNSDQFLNEYLPKFEKRIEFLTNFDGSNAFIILNKNQSYFFTDSRYLVAAKEQIDQNIFKIINISKENPTNFLIKNCQNKLIAFDPKLHSAKFIINLLQNNLDLKSIYNFYQQNPIDEIWQDKKTIIKNIFLHKEKFAGQKWQEKIKEIYQNFDKNSDAIFITSAESCSYLFNIRSFYIDYVPTCPSYAIITKSQKILLILHKNKLNDEVIDSLQNIEIIDFDNHLEKINDFCQKNNITNIEIDFNQSNYFILNFLQNKNFNLTNKIDPTLLKKAIKNKIAINGIKKAHEKDAIALIKFLYWLKNHSDQSEISEIIASKKLLEFRSEDPDFICPSFETISAFAENGAIIHYKVTEKTNKYFNKNSLYLFDSGGQYQYGTTDITRVVAIGKIDQEYKKNFTLVLKGHIALAKAKFPIGTRGDQLDILARQYLWQEGKDYGHGTGHLVGHFLNVHEGPSSISPRYNQFPLQENMILSNEPGFYIENEYGIRIENLMLIKQSEEKNFLEFETVTLVPIDLDLIDFDLLNDGETKWLQDYHQKIYQTLFNNLDQRYQDFLRKSFDSR